MMRNVLIASILGLALAGCQTGDTNTTDPTTNPSRGGDAPAVDGTYDLVSTFDLTVDTLLPPQLYGALQVLEDLRQDPATTLFDILEAAGVPLVGDLLDALPGPVEDEIKGWINDYVFSAIFDNQQVTDALDELNALAKTVLTQFDVESELVLPVADSEGHAVAAHGIRALRFPVGAQGVSVEVPLVAGATQVSADTWIESDNRVVFGEHGFGLPYGEYAYAALNAAVVEKYGSDIRGALGQLMNCPALAESVSSRCIAFVCVGHREELEAICEQGLDRVVEELESKFVEMRFDALTLESGEAELGISSDGRAESLDSGTWQGAIDLGQGPRDIGATFSGSLGN